MNVRPFALSDLERAARFADAARERDPFIEPFGERLPSLAHAERARLSLWRVLEGEGGELHGIALAVARDSASVDLYAAVDPRVRRQGFGGGLLAAALASRFTLRARVAEEVPAGRAFLRALGFAQRSAQLTLQVSLSGSRQPSQSRAFPRLPAAFRVRAARPSDEAALRTLLDEAWRGAPDVFAPRPDDEVFAGDRLLWLAERDGQPAGYLAARTLGRGVAIEELAVLPDARRHGIGRALVLHALQGARGAMLSVAEDNLAARALYESLGFTASSRRLVYEKKPL